MNEIEIKYIHSESIYTNTLQNICKMASMPCQPCQHGSDFHYINFMFGTVDFRKAFPNKPYVLANKRGSNDLIQCMESRHEMNIRALRFCVDMEDNSTGSGRFDMTGVRLGGARRLLRSGSDAGRNAQQLYYLAKPGQVRNSMETLIL